MDRCFAVVTRLCFSWIAVATGDLAPSNIGLRSALVAAVCVHLAASSFWPLALFPERLGAPSRKETCPDAPTDESGQATLS